MTGRKTPSIERPVHVYDPDEAAEILHCRASWLKEKARRREIPFALIGGAYRWTDQHLAEIVRLGERAATSVPSRQAPRRSVDPATNDSAPVLRARLPRRRQRANDSPAA